MINYNLHNALNNLIKGTLISTTLLMVNLAQEIPEKIFGLKIGLSVYLPSVT